MRKRRKTPVEIGPNFTVDYQVKMVVTNGTHKIGT